MNGINYNAGDPLRLNRCNFNKGKLKTPEGLPIIRVIGNQLNNVIIKLLIRRFSPTLRP
jgi:hypothetical protein